MNDSSSNPEIHTFTASSALVALAQQHLSDVLRIAFEHSAAEKAVVVFDTRSELAVTLTAAYRHCLPHAHFIDFDHSTPEQVLAEFADLAAKDLVVLVQSTHFRLEAFRIRVELFKRSLKVIEHPHLGRMPGAEVAYYIDSLAYDPGYYRDVGHALKAKIDAAPHGMIDSGAGNQLIFATPFESAKLNIGDYRQMNNTGGQFPLGEVFTEAADLDLVHGRVRIFIFGDTRFRVNRPATPITLVIEKSQVIDVIDSTPEFDAMLAMIRADEGGVVWVRELGLGMNRAFSFARTVSDIGTYERMCGIHLSLGMKHGIYAKPHIKRGEGKYHIDVFAITDSVQFGDDVVYRDGQWVV
ncbi:hypothetical protein HQN60_09760 [Deefgea piscis]|uniref:Aminopeptidase n=1 Tax=Deefgea piscis TaxID=2739061 RepID=A0A6M8SU00_9NEIS|nr:hypothetical protein [Deefgea piscis]QKJ66956.1 hypothetical protein HQN60_09760 [Deefgea piscis]